MPKLDKAHHGTHASMQKNVRERKGSFDHETKTCKDMKEEKNSQDQEEMDEGAVGELEWGLGEQKWSLGDLFCARRAWFLLASVLQGFHRVLPILVFACLLALLKGQLLSVSRERERRSR